MPTLDAQEKLTIWGLSDLLQIIDAKNGNAVLGGVDSSGLFFGSLAAGPRFSDAEVPQGTIPGTIFTLDNTPNPTTSLILVWNATTLINGVGYNLMGNMITTNKIVGLGDTLVCWYRY